MQIGALMTTVRRLLPVVLLAIAAWPAAVRAADVAVLYPDIREPYRAVFLEIVKGIRDTPGLRTSTFALPERDAAARATQWLADAHPDALIALGNRGLRVARALEGHRVIVVGAVLADPDEALNGFSGIVLTPDPGALFRRLREIAPQVTRVLTVYSKKQNQWLIDLAKREAAKQGISLRAFPAENLQESAQRFRDILKGPISQRDAIWLPQDANTVDEQAVLPFILQEAWNRNVVVFSSNPAHVRRGALFSLFPDNEALGRSLAAMAKQALAGEGADPPRVRPLQDLLTAVNIRTAEHLGIDFSARELRRFDLVFPSP